MFLFNQPWEWGRSWRWKKEVEECRALHDDDCTRRAGTLYYGRSAGWRCVGEQRRFPRLRYSGGGDVASGVGVTARRAEVISSSGDNRDLANNQLFRSRNPHPTPHSHTKLTVILESLWGYMNYIPCTSGERPWQNVTVLFIFLGWRRKGVG